MSPPIAYLKLGDIAELNPRLRVALDDSARVSFLPMSALNAETASTTLGQERAYAEVRKGYTPFLNGDVLIAKITPCFENGKIAQAVLSSPVGFGSTEFHVVRPRSAKSDARYLLHFLRLDQIRIDGERKMTGSGGQRRVPEHFLANLDVPLPSLLEQKRIAAVLDASEALRASRRNALAQLNCLTQSIFLKMFGDPVANERAWPSRVVSDFVAGFETGKSIVGDDEENSVSPYRVLKISAVTSLEFRSCQSKAMPPDYNPPESHKVRVGDLLFSRANTSDLIGATAYVADTPPNLLLPDKLWRFVWYQDERATPHFVRFLFQHPKFRREISKRSTGTSGSMKNISQAKVLSIRVGLPPIALQQTFTEYITAIEALKGIHRAALGELDALFASLQHRAFRGEL